MSSYWKHFFIDNGDIALIESGAQAFIANQVNHYKVKHDYVIHYVRQGKGSYRVQQKTYPLSAGDGFVLRKNSRVYYAPDPEDPWTLNWIGIGGQAIDDYLGGTQLAQLDTWSFDDKPDSLETMKAFVDYLCTVNHTQPAEASYILSQVYLLISHIQREFATGGSKPDSYQLMETSLAEEVYKYIYAHFLDKLTVQEVAAHFGISRSYLFELCKHHFDQSPKQIIQELRMNQASQLLRGTTLQVSEIANIIGYSSPFVFSKMFKEYYHYSPSDFRRLDDATIDQALFIRHKFIGH